MDRNSELIKIAAAAVAYKDLTGQELPKYAAGGLAGLLGLAPKKTSVWKWLLPILGVGGAGALAFSQKDKISDIFGDLLDKVKGLTGGSAAAPADAQQPSAAVKKGFGSTSQQRLENIIRAAGGDYNNPKVMRALVDFNNKRSGGASPQTVRGKPAGPGGIVGDAIQTMLAQIGEALGVNPADLTREQIESYISSQGSPNRGRRVSMASGGK